MLISASVMLLATILGIYVAQRTYLYQKKFDNKIAVTKDTIAEYRTLFAIYKKVALIFAMSHQVTKDTAKITAELQSLYTEMPVFIYVLESDMLPMFSAMKDAMQTIEEGDSFAQVQKIEKKLRACSVVIMKKIDTHQNTLNKLLHVKKV